MISRFPTGHQFEPNVYLAQFPKYGASNNVGHDLDILGSHDTIGHMHIGLAR